MNNRYETTIQVLSAAIIRLAKLTKVSVVYRAPGRALPASFWEHAHNGLAGVIETGMLSTSANKQVAMEYASRSSAKLLFELRLGFVARGADIGRWGLSQYPSEGEILLPPLTALQMVEVCIEKDLVIVAFRPTVMIGTTLKTGEDDVAKAQLTRQQEKRAAKQEQERLAKEAAADHMSQQWKASMADVKHKAVQLKASDMAAKAEEAKVRDMEQQIKQLQASEEETKRLHEELLNTQARAAAARDEAEAVRADADHAAELEAVLSKQLHWVLLDTNQRLARARLSDIVMSYKLGQKVKRWGKKRKGEGTPIAKRASSVDEGSLLNPLETIIQSLTEGRARKAVTAAEWDEQLIVWFTEVTKCMQGAPASMRVQSMGCCAMACLTGEIGQDLICERSQRLAEAAVAAGCVDAIQSAFKVLPKVAHHAGEQAIRTVKDVEAAEVARRKKEAFTAKAAEEGRRKKEAAAKAKEEAAEEAAAKAAEEAAAQAAEEVAAKAAEEEMRKKEPSPGKKKKKIPVVAPPPAEAPPVPADLDLPIEGDPTFLEVFRDLFKKTKLTALAFMRKYDREGKGLTKKQFRHAVRDQLPIDDDDVLDADIDVVFAVADVDKAGRVTPEELQSALKRSTAADSPMKSEPSTPMSVGKSKR